MGKLQKGDVILSRVSSEESGISRYKIEILRSLSVAQNDMLRIITHLMSHPKKGTVQN